jgi:4-amino-4-deoxy-L-arabinose transferase-like glycosyltransferase
VLALGALVAASGAASLPLDGHEALVVQTAREMRERGEWIVPYYNGEVRLVKPPLGYWLVRIASTAAGSPERIEPWHGRLPSIASGLGLLAVVVFVGARLFDRPTALVAGGLAVSSAGFMSGTHDARVDMLYAFLCGLGIAFFVGAWSARERGRPAALPIHAMWLCFGAAVLAKGPHVPAMLVAALALFCGLRGPGWRASLALLRPASGVLVAALLGVPWWVALAARVTPEALAGTELAGTLLAIDGRQILSPYYVGRTLVFALPWALFLPAALRLFRRRELRSDGVVLLGLLVAVPLVALGLGKQQRAVYALPAWAPLAILLAAGVVQDVRGARTGNRAPLWPAFAPLWPAFAGIHVAGICLCAWIAWSPGTRAVGRFLAACGLLAALLLLATRRAWARREPWIPLGALVGLSSLVFAAGAQSRLFFSPSRFARVRLAEAARAAAGERTPIATLGLNDTPYVYYSGRRIERLESAEQLLRRSERSETGEVIVLALTARIGTLPPGLVYEVLDAFPEDEGDAGSLLRVSAAPPRGEPGPGGLTSALRPAGTAPPREHRSGRPARLRPRTARPRARRGSGSPRDRARTWRRAARARRARGARGRSRAGGRARPRGGG